MGAWRGYVYSVVVSPRYTNLGLITLPEGRYGYTIGYQEDEVHALGVRDGSRLVAVDGRRAPANVDEEAASRLLDGPAGQVAVTLRGPDGQVATYRLTRNPRAGDDDPVSDATFFLITSGAGLAAALATLAVAVLLVRRRRDDPVAFTLSAAFLALVLGLPVSDELWSWLWASWIGDGALGVALALFLIALPAFPDGRYAPRWGGWLVYAALPVAGAIVAVPRPEARVAIALLAATAAATVPAARFRQTEPGIVRQQLKWIGFGFFASVVTLGFGFALLLLVDYPPLPFVLRAWIQVAAWAMIYASVLLLPFSMFVAIRRYRLWDADRVLGRSAGWAVLTLAGGAIWSVSTGVLEQVIVSPLAGGDKNLSTGLSTVLALAVLGPLRKRIVDWTDRHFRAGLIQLRGFPARLGIWQHDDTPEDIAARVTSALAGILTAERVALAMRDDDGAERVIGAAGIAPDQAAAALFPLRIALDDGDRPIGALLLGPRADGSLYGKDERAELAKLEPALTAALRRSQSRAGRDRHMRGVIAELEGRLARLERPAQSRQ